MIFAMRAMTPECMVVAIGSFSCPSCMFARLHFQLPKRQLLRPAFDQLEVVNTVGTCRDRRLLQVYAGIHCDACGQSPILGERFRCTECHDYDLCNICYRKMDHPHVQVL